MIQKSASRKAFIVFNTLFFSLICFICFYPIWYVLIQSLSDNRLAVRAIVYPLGFTFRNYIELLSMDDIFHACLISVLRTVIGTAATVAITMTLGYAFSKEEMPFRRLMYRLLIVTMYVSGGLIPTYLVYKAYGLVNNFWVYIVPGMINAYYIILVKTYVEQLPASVEESAMIDGAGTMTLMTRIIFPMAIPIAATIAVFTSVAQWNAWFDNQIYTVSAKQLTTLQFLLYNYLNQAEQMMQELRKNSGDMGSLLTPRGIKMTITMITVVPILCVYPFMQRYIVKGITIGAVKG